MRIKFLSIIASFFFVSLALTSCLDDDTVTEYSSDATIRGFSINNIKTEIFTETDTTTFTVTGSQFPFTIDQLSAVGQIYNTDSLPVNTDITKVSVNFSSQGVNISYKLKDKDGNDSICWWATTDSINFTNPVTFTVYAADAVVTKEYDIKINVHKCVPDSLVWNEIKDNNFPGTSFTGGQKAVTFKDRIYVFADATPQIKVAYTNLADGKNWATIENMTDIDTKADYSSVIVFHDRFYITAAGETYSSEDAINWQKENVQATNFIGAFSDRLIGRNNKKFIYADYSNGAITWKATSDTLVASFPKGNYSYATYPLITNPAIERMMVMGETPNPADTSAVAWSLLSNENTWVDYTTNTVYDCPNLKNISMIYYDNLLYAFGSGGEDNKEAVKAFEYFYASRDNGKIWKKVERYVRFPEEFLDRTEAFSYVVDKNNFIWIMWSGKSEVWKGKINRLGFKN